MRHDAFSRQADDAPSVVVLEADSPLSYVQLVGHIAGCGAAFVIDPYGRAEHLWRLIQDTTTVRVLIGPLRSKYDQDRCARLATVVDCAAGSPESVA